MIKSIKRYTNVKVYKINIYLNFSLERKGTFGCLLYESPKSNNIFFLVGLTILRTFIEFEKWKLFFKQIENKNGGRELFFFYYFWLGKVGCPPPTQNLGMGKNTSNFEMNWK